MDDISEQGPKAAAAIPQAEASLSPFGGKGLIGGLTSGFGKGVVEGAMDIPGAVVKEAMEQEFKVELPEKETPAADPLKPPKRPQRMVNPNPRPERVNSNPQDGVSLRTGLMSSDVKFGTNKDLASK